MNIQFDSDDQYNYTNNTVRNQIPGGLIGILIRAGIAKTEKTAQHVLLITLVILILGTLIFYLTLGSDGTESDSIEYLPAEV